MLKFCKTRGLGFYLMRHDLSFIPLGKGVFRANQLGGTRKVHAAKTQKIGHFHTIFHQMNGH